VPQALRIYFNSLTVKTKDLGLFWLQPNAPLNGFYFCALPGNNDSIEVASRADRKRSAEFRFEFDNLRATVTLLKPRDNDRRERLEYGMDIWNWSRGGGGGGGGGEHTTS
jgi:hypothetical protein